MTVDRAPIDPDEVTRILRQVALEAVMPRFRNLGDGDTREKAPGDLVTIADEESEHLLAQRLPPLLAGSRVVGEEGAAADPSILDVLADDVPVWIVDPVDGTQNFADGVACFGLIAALCRRGEILAGWIHDPVNDRTLHALAGEGVWDGERRLAPLPAPPPVGDMVGYLGPRFRRRFGELREEGNRDVPQPIPRLKCVAREYMELAEGRRHFARYGGRLKPWDHAAGVLMLRELGGVARSLEGQDYRAEVPRESSLMITPDEMSWNALNDLMD